MDHSPKWKTKTKNSKRRKFCDIGLSKDSLDTTTKAQSIKEIKNYRIGLHHN